MKNIKLITMLLLCILLFACNDVTNSDEITNVKDNFDSLIEENVGNILNFQFDINNDEKVDQFMLVNTGDYSNTLIIHLSEDENYKVPIEFEIYGNIVSYSIVDITNDGDKDVFISTDLGGSSGALDYYCYTYFDDKIELVDFDSINSSENYEVNADNSGISLKMKDKSTYFEFSKEFKQDVTLIGNIDITDYFFLPVIISYSINTNSDIVINVRRALSIGHKSNEYLEIEANYMLIEHEWRMTESNIKVIYP